VLASASACFAATIGQVSPPAIASVIGVRLPASISCACPRPIGRMVARRLLIMLAAELAT
jgi:hypothetical protein